MLNAMQRAAKDAAAAHFGGPEASTSDPSSNIIGWGIGAKTTDETVLSDENVVRIYVRELLSDQVIPEQFGALPTDVIEVGEITADQARGRHRPALCGVSVGHPAITAGTLGCLVKKGKNHYILSNNHVLANSNGAEPGDRVLQPGPADGGTSPDDEIATLEPYQEIDFSGDRDNPNRIDAAIALVGDCNQTIVRPEIMEIGSPRTAPRDATFNQPVQKHGRTTEHTDGVVVDISADVRVNFRNRGIAQFDDQIVVKSNDSNPFSRGGDSGSLIVDDRTCEPVGLLFARSEHSGLTWANPIRLVLEHYRVDIVG